MIQKAVDNVVLCGFSFLFRVAVFALKRRRSTTTSGSAATVSPTVVEYSIGSRVTAADAHTALTRVA